MSVFAGPNITQSGLTLCLDAADINSYPGTGTTWIDVSNSLNNATLINGVVYNSNNQGNFNFNGASHYAQVGNTNVLSSTAYTKVVWFRPETATFNLVSGGTDSPHAFWMNGTSDTIRAGHNGNWATVSHTPGNMLNQWWCGAVTFNTTTGWILYLNGNQVAANATSTTTFTGTGVVRIGSYEAGANLFDGDIPVVQIYNRVLSNTEIQQNFNALRGRFSI